MSKLLFLFTLSLFSLNVFSQEQVVGKNYKFKSAEDVTAFSEDVMNSFSKGKIENAYSILRMKWILPENELDQLESLTLKQMNMVKERYGNIKSYEFVKDIKVNNSLIRKIYVLKFEYHLIPFYFTFYNNGNGWFLNGFKYSDEIDALLQ